MTYTDMKDSGVPWIGNIPAHWRTVRAKFYFRQTNNRGNKTPVLLAASQKYGMCPQSWLDGVVKVAEDTDLQQFKTVHVNDFVISLRSFQGGFEQSSFEGVCSPAYQVFHSIGPYDNHFLRYLFKSEMFIDEMNSLTVGIREGKNIKYEDFANSMLYILPLNEQSGIASYLDKHCAEIDAIISEAQSSIDDYKRWKASVIFQAVTKGLNPNVEMQNSGNHWIGEIPTHWRTTSIGHFVSIRSGLTLGKQYPAGTELVARPYLRVANVKADRFVLDNVTTIYVTPEEAEKYTLHPGDLLMTEGGDRDKLGRGTIWNGEITPCLHQNHVFAVTVNEKWMLTHFLKYVVASPVGRTYFDLTAKKTTNLASTNSTTILQFKVPIPPVEEQRKIIEWLDLRCAEIDSIIQEKESLIAELESYKKSLIYEAVTGKRKVV